MEIRPVNGHYTWEWLVSLNPSLEIDLTGNNQIPGLSPSLKVTHQVIKNVHIGVEHYADFGGFNRFLPGNEQDHITYLVPIYQKIIIVLCRRWSWLDNAFGCMDVKIILGGIPLGELINPNRW